MTSCAQPAQNAALVAAIAQLRTAKLVAYPTETVWGLAADSSSESAMQALRRWKGRPEISESPAIAIEKARQEEQPHELQPVSIVVPDASFLETLGFELSPAVQVLAKKFWPGPLTLVLPCPTLRASRFARGIARADGAVGVRCSPHPVAAALARAAFEAGLGPITSTSLNRSGEPPLQTLAEVRELCARLSDPHEIFVLAPDVVPDASFPCASEAGGVPSTVLDLAGPSPTILRPGAIARGAITQILDEVNQESEKR